MAVGGGGSFKGTKLFDFSLGEDSVFCTRPSKKQATTFAAEITSIFILYAANTGGNLQKIEFTFRLPKSNSSVASNYIVWHVAGIDLISALDKKYVYEKYKIQVKQSTAVLSHSRPSPWTCS